METSERKQALPEPAASDEYITLTQAAKLTPGRPSTNCLWRWCRRGVIARNGERIRLEHVRIGGKLFTQRRWLEEFGRRLASADSQYFDEVPPNTASGATAAAQDAPAVSTTAPHRRRSSAERRRRRVEDAEQRLNALGIQ